jgi:hypothetical protein
MGKKLRTEVCWVDALKTKDEYKPCPSCHKVTWKRTGLIVTDKPMGRTLAQIMLCLDCAFHYATEMGKNAIRRGAKDIFAPPCNKNGCRKPSTISLKIRTTGFPTYLSCCHGHLETMSKLISMIAKRTTAKRKAKD